MECKRPNLSTTCFWPWGTIFKIVLFLLIGHLPISMESLAEGDASIRKPPPPPPPMNPHGPVVEYHVFWILREISYDDEKERELRVFRSAVYSNSSSLDDVREETALQCVTTLVVADGSLLTMTNIRLRFLLGMTELVERVNDWLRWDQDYIQYESSNEACGSSTYSMCYELYLRYALQYTTLHRLQLLL